MPIEIRELVIKTTFEQHDQENTSSQLSDDMKDQIVKECMDQILEILKDKLER